ncbi:MAG: hypothetical protein V4574_10560 [Pseudomonadota bacterium]
MIKRLAVLTGLLLSGTAHAQDVKLKPLIDARLRYEHVDQAGIALPADALTLRVRAGGEATWGDWSALVEGETNLAIVDKYNDGTNGKTAYPIVVDPPNIELNRAQLRFAPKGGFALTAGRQRLEIADQRFVGPAGFRQNEQSFDAVRLQYTPPKGVVADLSYAWSDRTVNGRNGTGARQTAVDGDNVFAVLGYRFKPGTLTGFAYLVDQDEAVVQGYRLSSQTYGARFAGSAPLGKDVKLAYAASWARQSDYHRNPNDYAATYWLGEATLSARAFTLTGGYEVLGASSGAAFTSVQTPLASFFKFQGWAGKFNPTPPNGLRDAYATAGYGWKNVGPLDALGVSATWHRFDSDRLSQHYGDEIDLALTAKHQHFAFAARYAHYDADAFATDTDKFWLQLDWSL